MHFYGAVQEAVPQDAPETWGKEGDLWAFDAGDQHARQPRTGYFLDLNSAPIVWLSKKQAMTEMSVFELSVLLGSSVAITL